MVSAEGCQLGLRSEIGGEREGEEMMVDTQTAERYHSNHRLASAPAPANSIRIATADGCLDISTLVGGKFFLAVVLGTPPLNTLAHGGMLSRGVWTCPTRMHGWMDMCR